MILQNRLAHASLPGGGEPPPRKLRVGRQVGENAPHRPHLSTFRFGTKAATLEQLLATGGDSFIIPRFFYFTVGEWSRRRQKVLAKVARFFSSEDTSLAVRSSTIAEDREDSSSAGAFLSVLDVANEPGVLAGAIDRVIESFDDNSRNQILVQEMVSDVDVAGVMMTRNLDDGSPYYVFNYDDWSGRTDSITGGTGASKTIYLYHDTAETGVDSPRVRRMLRLARDLQERCGSDSLDIEFALDGNGQAYVLQVRPLATRSLWDASTSDRVHATLPRVVDAVIEASRRQPDLFGNRTILGNMSDWNPAEIIGATARPLAIDLYRELVTRRAWREARAAMGYRPIEKHDLMIVLDQRPFIDIRCSLNSFLPADISHTIAERLVNAALDRLHAHPELHDKLEFDVSPTALDFDFDCTVAKRFADALAPDELAELRHCLHRLTLPALDLGSSGSLECAMESIRFLERHQRQKSETGRNELYEQERGIRHQLDRCERYGTLPFAILARHAFICESLLRSAVARGAIAPERVAAFKASINTVAGDFLDDLEAVMRGEQAFGQFMARYGHLRPGTYDILSMRYDAMPDLLEARSDLNDRNKTTFDLDDRERTNLDALLAENGFTGIDANHLLEYCRKAIVGREYGKFVFSRTLSDSIEQIADWGAEFGLSREDLSFLNLSDVLAEAANVPLATAQRGLSERVRLNKTAWSTSRAVKLSYLVRGWEDVLAVPMHRSVANFVTDGRVEGRVEMLNPHDPARRDLTDAIVCIENADPGYDWIFTRSIRGLVTKYGGVNSHMAIRCAEFGLPAAIGCGELTFERLTDASLIELNCADHVLRTVR